jgi:hypothetical protein
MKSLYCHTTLFCLLIAIGLVSSRTAHAQKGYRLFNTHTGWVREVSHSTEQYPYLVELPKGGVFQHFRGITAPLYYFEVAGLDSSVTFKMRIADNSKGDNKLIINSKLRNFDTTFVLDARLFPPGNYELIKDIVNGRVSFRMAPIKPDTKLAKRAARGKRIVYYDHSSGTVHSRKRKLLQHLDDVWPARAEEEKW